MSETHVTYTIRTQHATFINEAIEASVITDIINDFVSDDNDFIVIEPTPMIQNTLYLQAISAPNNPGGIVVELRVQHDEESFTHYSYETEDTTEVNLMFLNYWGSQQVPDITNWTDITDQF